MRVELKYGNGVLPVELPEGGGFQGVLSSSEAEPLADATSTLKESLDRPISSPSLAEVAKGKRSACIVISDITRPVPNTLLLPPILETLQRQGIETSQIVILVATGMHRVSTDEEREKLVGAEIARTYRVIDHDSKCPDEMVEVGKIGSTVPSFISRHYVSADLKILTGFIEPHVWAGYSGGRKSLLPGISSIDTLQYMHGPEMVESPGCRYGNLVDNPFHEAGLAVMAMAGADFIVNVTLDTAKRVTGIFAGHPVEAHLVGCRFLAKYCVLKLNAPLDFIVTSNAGAPLDSNFYQSIKGMSVGESVVKPGGDILLASRCSEGFGSLEFIQVLDMVDSPQRFLDRIKKKEFFIPDQWCAHGMYKIIQERKVWIYSDGLSAEQLRRYHFNPVSSVEEGIQALLEKHGIGARWAVVPEGPMTILSLSEKV